MTIARLQHSDIVIIIFEYDMTVLIWYYKINIFIYYTNSNIALDITLHYISLLDSGELVNNNDIMDKLKTECIKSLAKHIIILTGTDKMTDIGCEIMNLNLDKTIILTGSMVPYSVHSTIEDAVFIFGCAVGFVQTLPSNTYIAMNGKYWVADKCKKDYEKNIFVDK